MLADRIVVHPGPLQGSVVAPPSKSVMQRACVAAWIRGGTTHILNPGIAADDRVVLDLMKAAGCEISEEDSSKLTIKAVAPLLHTLDQAHFGESGLAARMCTPILALSGRCLELTAAGSLSQRPMHFFEAVLPQLGVSVERHNGGFPIRISGRLLPATITVDGSVSSQFITGLLMAYAAADARDVSLTVTNPVSTPYIQLTLDVMRELGLKVPKQSDNNTYYFDTTSFPQASPVRDFTIEGDWSGAAFTMLAGAIAGRVVITGLDAFTAQGDKAILQSLMEAGVRLSIEATQVTVSPAALNAFHAIATDTPDLFPPLAVLACYAEGTSVIEGVERLTYKESNRANTIISELAKMGANITLQDDLMIIKGGRPLKGTTVSSHGDHRIAMMCAVAALGAEGPTTIDGAAAIAKSYPAFFKDLQSLGAQIEAAE